jgi:hypothetical protein
LAALFKDFHAFETFHDVPFGPDCASCSETAMLRHNKNSFWCVNFACPTPESSGSGAVSVAWPRGKRQCFLRQFLRFSGIFGLPFRSPWPKPGRRQNLASIMLRFSTI